MTVQRITIGLRKGEYILCVYSKTGKGVWVLDGTPDRVAQGVAVGQLGSAIQDALARSRAGLDELTRDSEPVQPLLDLLQLPNYAAYAKGTRSVEVYRNDDTIEVTPFRNEGGARGFTPIKAERTALSPTSPEQLATEVLNAFDKTR